MRAETTDRLLDYDLEKRARNKRVGETGDAEESIGKAAIAWVKLAEEDAANGNGSRHDPCRGRGEDGRHIGVGELWVDDVARLGEGDGEVAHAS